MASTASSEAQLLAEHFGYPPVSLLDDIINSINILAEQALNSVEKGLLSVPPSNLGFRTAPAPPPQRTKSSTTPSSTAQDPSPEDARRHEVENGTHQLETLLCASIDRNFDLFELWVMRNILTVRPDDRDWIRLSHYEGLDFSAVEKQRRKGADATGEADGEAGIQKPDGQLDDACGGGPGSDIPTVESVARLRRRLQASQKLNVMLHAERSRNAALLAELRGVLQPPTVVKAEGDEDQPASLPQPAHVSLAFLRSRGDLTDSDASTPLTTTTAFSLSQLQALRALSTSLRTMKPDLQDAVAAAMAEAGSVSGAQQKQHRPTSWRTERLEYVEGAARKHLENVRGLELGRDGEVRDGEWQGPGRSFGPGEVEGLERVVAAIGGGGGGGSGKGGGDREGEDEDESMDD